MKQKIIFAIIFLAGSLTFSSCGGKDKKGDAKTSSGKTIKSTTGNEDLIVPAIDIASLKDESSILGAMQKVTDGRIADEKKQKEDPGYKGHYLEFTKLYTDVLKASTEYAKSIPDPAKAIEFQNKINKITDKMYEK